MKTNVDAVNKDADIQFLQKMGSALLLMALVAGSVTIFGAATLRSDSVGLWPTWQFAETDAAE